MELLAAENQEVLSGLGTSVEPQGGDLDVDDIKIQEIVKEYEELLGEKEEILDTKTETIRQLHRENQDLKQQLEKRPAAAPPASENDLQSWAEELERKFQELEQVRHDQDQEREELKRERAKLDADYRQLEEDKESMERDLGRMEAELAQERVAVQRQRIDLQRVLSEIEREFKKLQSEGDLQKRLEALKRLKDRQPEEAAPQGKKSTGGSGFFSRFGRNRDS
jgi:chromosome segregation ATPase